MALGSTIQPLTEMGASSILCVGGGGGVKAPGV
jgi:hypothetical protein